MPAPESVRVARRAVAEFAARCGADTEAVALAVSETVTNAILHAHRDGDGREITLTAHPNGGGIVVTVIDQGEGIKPNPESPGLGFGLAMVASLADEIGIRSTPQGGTAVKMRFQATG